MSKMPVTVKAIKQYARFWTERVYYEETYVQGVENIPSDGTPVLVTCNHQNSLNDALGIMLAINDRKANFIVRADVFALSPVLRKFLNYIGLLPAYRLNYEGSEAIKANASTFKISEQALIEGETVVMFPEGGHAEGHWFNMFKGGMAKMAFEAAELANFEKDIKIVPACNHYSSYYGLRNKMLVRFGEAVSVMPYYELYKTKPRTAMRQLTDEIHGRIEAMVLNIKDKEYYNEIEYIRNGAYGNRFAEIKQFEPEDFEARFESDKLLVDSLYNIRVKQDPYFVTVKTEEGQSLQEIADYQIDEQNKAFGKEGVLIRDSSRFEITMGHARSLIDKYRQLGINEKQFISKPEMFLAVLRILALVALLPVALVGLWPSVISWMVPKHFSNKAKGVMFEGTFVIALNLLVIIPFAAIITFVAASLSFTVIFALLYVLLFPLIFQFEWMYVQTAKQALADLNYIKAPKSAIAEIQKERSDLFRELDELLGV